MNVAGATPDGGARPVFDPVLGFWRLDPLPAADDLDAFYDAEYFSGGSGRAPDIERLRVAGEAADAERTWRSATIYADIAHYLRMLCADGGRVVDVGCGTGEFVIHMSNVSGWSACGVELSPEGVAIATDRGGNVVRGTIHDVLPSFGDGFDALTMFNVLEHVRDPFEVLDVSHRLLRSSGVLVVQVPNDFASLQLAVRDHLGVDPWWIAVPDHINYFDFDSLESVLADHGFSTVVRYGTFPMEFFLLAGFDYLSDRDAGAEAHRRRCAFEMSMGDEQRRRLYEGFGRAGLGRNAVLIARRG